MTPNQLQIGSKRLDNVNFSPVRKVLERANELAKSGKEIIHFEIGEPDFDTPKSISEAVAKTLIQDKLTHYGPNRGDITLRKAISDEIKADDFYEVDPNEEIIITVGASEAIFDTIMGIVDVDDEVIIFTPAFMNYENCIKMAGAKCIKVCLREENLFQIDEDVLTEVITEKTKMIIVNNPNNPTGSVLNESSLKILAKLAIKHNLVVLSDEIYRKIIYDNVQFCSLASMDGMKERTITINGFSKVYAMTGWRLGYIVADKKFIPPILKVHQYTTTCAPTFIQVGLAIGMRSEECRNEVSNMIHTFNTRRDYIMNALSDINQLGFTAPEAAFYIMVNVVRTGLNGEEFATRLLEEKGVATVPGKGFGEDCANSIRISYANSMENLIKGMNRISEFVNELQNKNR